MAASRPMMTTTMRSSISVKPALLMRMLRPSFLVLAGKGCGESKRAADDAAALSASLSCSDGTLRAGDNAVHGRGRTGANLYLALGEAGRDGGVVDGGRIAARNARHAGRVTGRQ